MNIVKENMKNEKEETILKKLKKKRKEAINSAGKKYYSIQDGNWTINDCR